MAILKIIPRYAVVFFLIVGTANAQNLQLQEREIQAGLLYNFMKYTSWSSEKMSGSGINICIIGQDPFDGHLAPLSKRTVNRKNIIIKKIQEAEDASECHLLIVGGDKKSIWNKIGDVASGNGILTVSTEPGFSANNGMIEFGRNGSKISVTLNVSNVKQAKLNIADRMLKLVMVVN